MILVHDALHGEISIHAEFFEDTGFLRQCAGIVVVFQPLEAVVWSLCSDGWGNVISKSSVRYTGERKGGDHSPVVVSVEMEGAEVDVLQVKDGGEIFPGSAVVIEIPIISSSPIAEVAISAKGDQMVRVDGFDVLADLIGPSGQDLAAIALGFFASSL